MNCTGHYQIALHQTDSTNKEAFRLLDKQDLIHGTLITASEQTAGRGQAGSFWESEPGSNLTFSIVLKPDFLEPSRQFLLTKVVSLALFESVSNLVNKNKVFIKWPNDIYIDNGKVAGILIENRIMGSKIQVSIAGIGINVNQRIFLSSAPNPVSISQITQKKHDLQKVLGMVCTAIDKRYGQLQNGQIPLLDHDYLQALLGFNTYRNFQAKDKILRAAITGVNDYGCLKLKDISGETHEFDMKEITFLF